MTARFSRNQRKAGGHRPSLQEDEFSRFVLNPSRRHPHLPMLVLLLAGSGCAALIYEIVWSQLLQLVIGSSGISLGLLLATYMGGLCLGSALLARLVSR